MALLVVPVVPPVPYLLHSYVSERLTGIHVGRTPRPFVVQRAGRHGRYESHP